MKLTNAVEGEHTSVTHRAPISSSHSISRRRRRWGLSRLLIVTTSLAGWTLAAIAALPTQANAQSNPAPYGAWCGINFNIANSHYPNGYVGTIEYAGWTQYWSDQYCIFPTAAAACAGTAPGGALSGYQDAWWLQGCENSNSSYPVMFSCKYGYASAPGKCVSDLSQVSLPANPHAPDRCSQPTGGQTPHPIDVFSGAKLFDRTDYETGNGLLSLRRRYNAEPLQGPGFGVIGTPFGLQNWAFDFAYEIQIGDWQEAPNSSLNVPIVSVVSPSGSYYQFIEQSNGALIPYQTTQWPNPQTEYSLKLVGSWPAPGDLSTTPTTWQLTDADDTVWTLQTYSPAMPAGQPGTAPITRGHVISKQMKNGQQVTFSYNTYGQLQSATDSYGNTITFDSVYQGTTPVVTAAHLPGGYTVKYNYDLQGTSTYYNRLTSVQYLDSTGTVKDAETYKYGNASFPNAITEIDDVNGQARWYVTYDAQGRATTSYGPGNVDQYTVSYGAPGTAYSNSVTNSLGKTATYNYSRSSTTNFDSQLVGTTGVASTNCPASATSVAYGSDRQVSSSTDELGHVNNYQWNSRGLPTQVTTAVGTAQQETVTKTWDTTYRNPITITAPTYRIDHTYDTQGRLLTRTYTDLTTQTTPYSTNGQTRTWTYKWGTTGGAVGQIVSIDGPLPGTGDTTSLTYSAAGNLASVTDPAGKVTTITTWDWHGLPTTVVDPNNISTTFTYDIHGWPLTTTVNPGSAQHQYTFAYDVVGNVAKITLPTGGYLQYSYDTGSRLTTITNDKGETITLTPNAAGQATQSVTKSSSATITAQTSMVYDELGRLIQTLGSASTTPTILGYDKLGEQTTFTDGRSKLTSTTYDALNRVASVTNPENQALNYTYDTNDVLASQTDGRNQKTSFVTDGFGDVTQEVSPDRGTRTYWYDTAGRLTKWVDGDSEETDFSYDTSNRLVSKTFPEASQENVTYTYDSTASSNKGNGRLTSVTEQSGSTSFIYDAFGRVTTDTKNIQGLVYNVSYGYDLDDNVTQLTLPSGRVITYQRNNEGAVTSVSTKPSASGTTSNVATSVTYQPFGPLTSLTYGNGLTLTRTYNTNYWLTEIQVKNGATALLDLGYQYYDDGRLGEIDDNAATGRTVYFSLTDSGRLNYAAGPWGQESYSWDASGNRIGDYLTVGSTTTTTNEITWGTGNRLALTNDQNAVTKRTLQWRLGGDLYSDTNNVTGATYTYLYNARKRLVEINLGSATAATYGYDFKEQRVWRNVAGTTNVAINYIYDENGRLLAEHNGNTGAVIREYVWLDDMPLAVIDSSSGTATTYYIHTGHLDEPQMMTNAAKTEVWNAYMTPFGKATVFTTASANVDMRLPGQWFQSEAAAAGLNQNHYRDYDPSLGRYIEADPMGLAGGPNSYSYVDGDVYDLTDIWGLQVDLNLFPQNQDIYQNANRDTVPFPGTYTVGVHSNGQAPIDSNHKGIPAQTLAQMIQADPKYKKGQTVTLAACRIGNSVYMQYLANRLHATVIGPKGYAWYPSTKGKIYSADKGQFHFEFPTWPEPWVTVAPQK